MCASHLYGMEQDSYKQLPQELKQEMINNALAQRNIGDAVKMVRGLYILQHGSSYHNLADFTKLVHMLANRFTWNTKVIADIFDIPVSLQYLNLVKQADTKLGDDAGLTELIKEGLDVNATMGSENQSLLIKAVYWDEKLAIIKLLLDAGANPHYKDGWGKNALHYAKQNSVKEVVRLLEERMQK